MLERSSKYNRPYNRRGITSVEIPQPTPHEMKVVRFLALGLTQKEIARELGNSPRTIEVHTARLRDKCEARTLAQIVAVAFCEGWLTEQSLRSGLV